MGELVAAERLTGDSLEGAPELLQTPEERPSLAEAKLWCKTLANTHYENFHVATWLLPARVRPHFESVYAYCRVSDDLGDEVESPALALRLLGAWGAMLDECYDRPERSRHPVFIALRETIVACNLPRSLFADLLDAFRQDQVKPNLCDLGRDDRVLSSLGESGGQAGSAGLRVPRRTAGAAFG